MKNLRGKLRKLDKQIAEQDRVLAFWKNLPQHSMFKKTQDKRVKLDERRKAVRLERKKYGRQTGK